MPEMIEIPRREYEKMEKGFEEMRKEIEEWEATLKTLKNKEVMEGIKRSQKEVAEGKVKSWKEVREKL